MSIETVLIIALAFGAWRFAVKVNRSYIDENGLVAYRTRAEQKEYDRIEKEKRRQEAIAREIARREAVTFLPKHKAPAWILGAMAAGIWIYVLINLV